MGFFFFLLKIVHFVEKFEDYWTTKATLRSRFTKSTKYFKEPLNMEDVLINFYEKNRGRYLYVLCNI